MFALMFAGSFLGDRDADADAYGYRNPAERTSFRRRRATAGSRSRLTRKQVRRSWPELAANRAEIAPAADD
jgi:hypothetical protein